MLKPRPALGESPLKLKLTDLYHANSGVLYDLFAKAGMQDKREAQGKLLPWYSNRGTGLSGPNWTTTKVADSLKCMKGMAGTTGLEPAASAVTVSGLQVLSTTWKSTDGTRSHWKYVLDNAIVYRDVYRGAYREDLRKS